MKKLTLVIFLLFLFLTVPATGHAAYIIHLKNGGQIGTPYYWKENQELKLYVPGGVVGIEKDNVQKIEKISDDSGYVIKPVEKPPQTAENTENESEKKEKEKIDIKAYKKKKDEMTVELEGLIEKVKETNRRKDYEAKRKAQAEMRKVAGQIYKLTDEVTEANDGKLPDGWWKK